MQVADIKSRLKKSEWIVSFQLEEESAQKEAVEACYTFQMKKQASIATQGKSFIRALFDELETRWRPHRGTAGAYKTSTHMFRSPEHT